jgi:hypothetical protein
MGKQRSSTADNKIADCGWKGKTIGGLVLIADENDPRMDEDQAPTTEVVGDGLTVHEEYRGFVNDNTHFRTDPYSKDLFIYTQLGNGYVSSLNVNLHNIGPFDYEPTDNRIDFNDTEFGGDIEQCALLVFEEPNGEGLDDPWASCVSKDGIVPLDLMVPCEVEQIRIFTGKISSDMSLCCSGLQYGICPQDTVCTQTLYQELESSTIAHEVGHGLTVLHWLYTDSDSPFESCIPISQHCVYYSCPADNYTDCNPPILTLPWTVMVSRTGLYLQVLRGVPDQYLPDDVNSIRMHRNQ